jgi:hypothetical protein
MERLEIECDDLRVCAHPCLSNNCFCII